MKLRFCNHEDIISREVTCHEGILTKKYIDIKQNNLVLEYIAKKDYLYALYEDGTWTRLNLKEK